MSGEVVNHVIFFLLMNISILFVNIFTLFVNIFQL